MSNGPVSVGVENSKRSPTKITRPISSASMRSTMTVSRPPLQTGQMLAALLGVISGDLLRPMSKSTAPIQGDEKSAMSNLRRLGRR